MLYEALPKNRLVIHTLLGAPRTEVVILIIF